ncbi:hypothetical protein GRI39_12190 [Altererythrobacter indicus]|uniref:PilZ domain-containing protein n=1 Tax=Altericroceibacterium indicum TaxID=374177 RepID=A0A845ADC9_9SPHN|nr:PilZ domain-containing protein [Altericroceibacterium indicum]MXP26795.1 hypothetical protein [Altericroceibacterium indicum]
MTITKPVNSPGLTCSDSSVVQVSSQMDGIAMCSASNERRDEQRHITIYRPCCVETASGDCCIGIIRNISDSGAQIETPCLAPVGSQLTYFWDGGPVFKAEVVWAHDGRIGLHNITVEEVAGAGHFPARAIRVPTDLPATIWHGSGCCSVRAHNISQKGVMVLGLSPLIGNTLVTVEIGGFSFPQASIRWREGRKAGIGFEKSVPIKCLMEILAGDTTIACTG